MRRVNGQGSARQSETSPAVKSALEVSKLYPVFPCDPETKRPLVREGFHAASQDAETVRGWWGKYPEARIGVPTGLASGLVAIDIDPRGRKWLQANRHRLGPHRTHQTRRGWHLLYRYPAGQEIRNSTSELADGVDVRGEGGYVIWWPAHGGFSNGEPGVLQDWLKKPLLNGHANGHQQSEEACDWEAERPRVFNALSQLDPDCTHDEWRDVAAALSWATGGSDDGEEMFVQWSRGDYSSDGRSAKFPGEGVVRLKYRSFRNDKDNNKTLATIYGMLKEQGKKVPEGRPEKTKLNGKHADVLLVRSDKVREKKVDWLWKGFLARNKFHLLSGSGGVMKSTLTLSLAATITNGGKWPDGTRCAEPGNVILWTGEDDLADTVKPRFRYAGGDERRMFYVKGVREKGQKRDFDPALDAAALEKACKELGEVSMIIIDPAVSVVQKDNNSASDVRRSLGPLVALGLKYHAVILGLQHFTKGSKGRDPAERVLGSGAWTHAARIVLVAAAIDEGDGTVADRMVFTCAKTFSKSAGGFEYTYEEEADTEIARIKWGKHLEGTAKSILAEAEGTEDGGSKLGEAKKFLTALLANGPKDFFSISKQAEAAEIKGITLKRAKISLGIKTLQVGKSAFVWELPDTVDTPDNGR